MNSRCPVKMLVAYFKRKVYAKKWFVGTRESGIEKGGCNLFRI